MKKTFLTLSLATTMLFGNFSILMAQNNGIEEASDSTNYQGYVVQAYDKVADGTVKVYNKVADGTVNAYNATK